MPPRTETIECPFQSLVDLLGRKHSLKILYAVAQRNPLRFSELREMTGVNPSTLTSRLRDFETAGLFVRTSFNEIPPRVEYRLSAKGDDLTRLFESLDAWYRRHGEAVPGAPPAATRAVPRRA